MADLFIAGLAAKIGSEKLSVIDAVRNGQYESERAKDDGYLSVVQETNAAPYEMAAEVSRLALNEAGQEPEMLVYGSIHRHGQPRLWSPASWLQRELGMSGATPTLAIQQGCNGLMQAVNMTMGQPSGPFQTGLYVGADCFNGSGFDRWGSDYGLIYGDAAAAFVLSRSNGFARILHSTLDGVPELEELHRDSDASFEGPDSWQTEYDVRRTKRAFLSKHGTAGFAESLVASLHRLRAGLEANPSWRGMADVLLTPFVGNKTRLATYEKVFGPLAQRNFWEIGRSLGHLGTTDGWVGLQLLRERGELTAGQHVLIVSAGVGFSCSITLLKILQT